jgi:serine/threonine-protein kinase
VDSDANQQCCPKCQKALDGLQNVCPHCGEDLRGLSPLADTLSGTAIGRLIDGRYKLREKLGEGGMGAVYKVEHVRMGKVCALKLLRPEIATDKKLKSRFHQEARVVSRLTSPNTIQVFDFGELEDGSLYLAMEYLSGRDLSWMLRAGGPLPEEKLLTIGIQVLSSLAEAHEQGVIHRDIKPANVMLVKRRERDDLVKVLDFGIAKLNEGEGRKHITGAADFIGTPSYMSPEQAKGEALDARSDLYSVGAMLFELATGKPPFEAATAMGIITRHLSEPPPRFQQVAPDKVLSPTLENIVRKALAKDRKDRFRNADEMRQALEKLNRSLASLPDDFTPLPNEDTAEMARREDFDQFERSLRVRRTLVPLLAAAVLLTGGALAWRYSSVVPMPNFHERGSESEPNEAPKQATPMELDAPMIGYLGPAPEATQADIDVFALEIAEPSLLKISLTGIPDLNLVLDAHLLPRGGDNVQRVLFIDDAPVGGGELVSGFWAQPGTLYLRVQEHPHPLELDQQRPPREKTRVPYTLEVTKLDVGTAYAEHEPNDTRDTAQKVTEVSKPLVGFLGTFVPETVSTRGVPWATHDFYEVDSAVGAPLVALIVPPADGRLVAVDGSKGGAVSAPQAGVDPTGAPKCVAPCFEAPSRIVLSSPKEGAPYVLRVQAAEWQPQPGKTYEVAFIHGGVNGLDSVLSLASTIAARGQPRIAASLLDMAVAEFPSSPQAQKAIDAAVQFKPVADQRP